MFQIGKLYQGLKFRKKKIMSPINNVLLKLKVPNLYIHKSCLIGKVLWGYSGDGHIHIKKNTIIQDWVCIMPYGGNIEIGENCSINTFCHISGNGGLKIGNNVRIASNTVIIPANHIFDDPSIPITYQGESQKGIVIEDDVWIGAGVRILDGVTIGSGCVVGAGSVVNKSLPPMSIAVGVPAKVIRERPLANL